MRMAASWFSIREDQPHTSLRGVSRAGWRHPDGFQIVDLYEQHLPAQCNAAAVLVTIKGKSLRDGQRPTLDRHCARRPMNPGAEAGTNERHRLNRETERLEDYLDKSLAHTSERAAGLGAFR